MLPDDGDLRQQPVGIYFLRQDTRHTVTLRERRASRNCTHEREIIDILRELIDRRVPDYEPQVTRSKSSLSTAAG